MRKIETQMNTAIRSRKDFRSGNTEVNAFTCGATGRLGSIVKLHGNKIAEVYANSIVLFDGGWQTVTTKSRLNALLDEFSTGTGVLQRNFEWFVTYKNLKEDIVSGMELALCQCSFLFLIAAFMFFSMIRIWCSVCCLYNRIINDLPDKSTSRMLRKD